MKVRLGRWGKVGGIRDARRTALNAQWEKGKWKKMKGEEGKENREEERRIGETENETEIGNMTRRTGQEDKEDEGVVVSSLRIVDIKL